MDRQRIISATKLLIFSGLMFGFGFSLVPLYDVFCEVTGLGGRTQKVDVYWIDIDAVSTPGDERQREVKVEFVGTVNQGMPWDFYPVERTLEVQVGTSTLAYFNASNRTKTTMVGQAVPSVSPVKAAPFFKKIECFCFEKQQLLGSESTTLGVSFIVDPRLPKGIDTITLAYTMFDVSGEKL